MEKFIVSARKYRPQTFDTVVGQSHITTTLKNAIKNQHLAHAFLFCGPRGVGKTTCARILAKTINCENVSADGEACNNCPSCTSFNEGSSLNIHELDAASNNSVDDIRTLVEQVRFAPQAGNYKVYIIDEVHMLSSAAFNAFLKTLEEPPSYAIFILATTEKHKILPTILSRCQIFDFKRITSNDTVEHLQEISAKEDVSAETAALQLIAQKSEGCMRDALSIMDKIVSFTGGRLTYTNTLEHLNVLDADYYFKLLHAMRQQDLASVLLLHDDINRKGFEGDTVLNGMAEFMRNLLVCKDERVLPLLDVVESFKDRYASAAKDTDASFLISALNVLNDAEINYRAARNKKLHVELALIKLTYLRQALSVAADHQGLDKKKVVESVRPVSFRKITPITAPTTPKEKKGATLTIEADEAIEKTDTPIEKHEQIHVPAEVIPAIEKPAAVKKAPARLGKLSEIREKISRASCTEEKQVIALTPEKLQDYWAKYGQILRENKNPAVQSFELAELRIVDDNSFEVITNNNLEQKFIEQEKRALSEYLQDKFCNKLLYFTISITDTPSQEFVSEKPMNKRAQFIKIVEQYPLVKDLKDRLKLELDY